MSNEYQEDIESDYDLSAEDEIIETDDDETSDEDHDEEPVKNKNNSNFKKLSKTLKEERFEKARILEEKEELEEKTRLQEEELEQWRTMNADTVSNFKSNKDLEEVKDTIFLLKNPDSSKYLRDVKEKASKHNMTLDEAWDFIKTKIPKESVTKEDFSIQWKKPIAKVNLSKVSIEEIYKWGYTKEQQKQWRALQR